MHKNNYIVSNAYSLIELLVVIAIFAILAVVSTQALTLSLRGTKKSESVIDVKDNVEYAMSTMERLLRNAQTITCTATATESQVAYIDEYGEDGRFWCKFDGTSVYYIASGAAANPPAITDNKVTTITNCKDVFVCTFSANAPPTLEINIKAAHPNNAALGAEGGSVNAQTRIMLRTY